MEMFGMEVTSHRIRLEEFMGDAPADPGIWMLNTEWLSVDMAILDMDFREEVSEVAGGLLDPGGDYAVVPLLNRQGVVLLGRGEYDEEEPVGLYRHDHDTLVVLPDHRGQGLGAFLVLAAATLKGGRTRPHELTPEGHAAHVAAHRLAVRMALAAGEDVPEEVLAEHPGVARSGGIHP